MKQVVGPLALGMFFVGMAAVAQGCELFTALSIEAAKDPGNGGAGPSHEVSCTCDNSCMVCDVAGMEGTCAPLPKGATTTTCIGDEACNGKGSCAAFAGYPCSESNDCLSGVCIAGTCRADLDAFCTYDVQCASNLCDRSKGVCTSCSTVGGAKCPGVPYAECKNGVCKARPGQPCDATLECAGSKCQSTRTCGLANTQICENNAECISGYCERYYDELKGTCTSCPAPPCKLPPGAYCIQGDQCNSKLCTGFPLRCAP